MKIFEILSAVAHRFDLEEMAKSQKVVIYNMEGFCFQIAVHVSKILNTPACSDELRNKWTRDITKHCNSLHREHQNNGRHPVQFNKSGNYRPLVDHSLAKIRSEMRGHQYTEVDRVREYTDFIRQVLSFSQNNYNTLNPFTSGWVTSTLERLQ